MGATDRRQTRSADLCRLGQRLACGVRPSYLFAKDIVLHRGSDTRLPQTASFLQVGGNVVVTALEERDGRAELRLFNPTTAEQTATLHWPANLAQITAPNRCQPVDLESGVRGDAIPVDRRREVSVGAKKIVTLRLE